jgi:hypothetical protein
MGKDIILKLDTNKCNGQSRLLLKKTDPALDFLRNKKKPKALKITINDFIWGED